MLGQDARNVEYPSEEFAWQLECDAAIPLGPRGLKRKPRR